jgi:branched-chain amino acid transport system ATP-binding protein
VTALLRVEKLNVAYGDVQVLWDVDLQIERGEIVALVGSNGAGKTTLLSAISGLLPLCSGQIEFEGRSLVRASTQHIVELGIAHVPEGRRLFGAMTVRDNLLMGAYMCNDRSRISKDLDAVLEMFPRLKERVTSLAAKLSGGEQQMVAIGRALMARPRLLLIDELSLGLAPLVVQHLIEVIAQVNKSGTTVLIVEQDVQVALEIANRGYVLDAGYISYSGPSESLLNDDRVKRAYLGI